MNDKDDQFLPIKINAQFGGSNYALPLFLGKLEVISKSGKAIKISNCSTKLPLKKILLAKKHSANTPTTTTPASPATTPASTPPPAKPPVLTEC